MHPSPPETPINTWDSGGKMKGDEILRVPFLKKILIFDKYPYISKMLAYGTNVLWLEHISALTGALLGHREL